MNHVTWTKTSTAKSFSPWHQKSSSVPKNWRFWGLWIKVYVDSYGTYFHSLKSLKSWKVNQTIFWLLPILTWYYFIFISTWSLRIDKYKVQKQKYFSILRRTKKIKKKQKKKLKMTSFTNGQNEKNNFLYFYRFLEGSLFFIIFVVFLSFFGVLCSIAFWVLFDNYIEEKTSFFKILQKPSSAGSL